MEFLDEVRITVRSGDGGSGCLSFRRERNTEFGGPDGGDGGRGGRIIIEVSSNITNTLSWYHQRRYFKARDGSNGSKSKKTGKKGKDTIIRVPQGTQVFLENEKTLLVDLVLINQRVILLEGGQGGRGNARFRSPINRAPKSFDPGVQGKELYILLKLRIISDVGILGLPNSGKSSFLREISRAKPKISNYPFTTNYPFLGVSFVNYNDLVFIDIPGISNNSQKRRDLNKHFLNQIERCHIILHLIDITQDDISKAYMDVRGELNSHSRNLDQKLEFICLSKIDLISHQILKKKIISIRKNLFRTVYPISIVTRDGISILLDALNSEILKIKKLVKTNKIWENI